MGSSGSGSFSDYSRKPSQPAGNGGSSGGSSGQDQCREAFNAGLEDVGLHDFFTANGTVPPRGTELTLELRKRVVAIGPGGLSVGALPTKFNYLAGCLREGIQYKGVIVNSSATPHPRVDADFAAI